MCILEIRLVDCLANKEDMEETVKRDYLDMRNLKVVSVTVCSKAQKLPIVTVPEKIGWIICRIRQRLFFHKIYKYKIYIYTCEVSN